MTGSKQYYTYIAGIALENEMNGQFHLGKRIFSYPYENNNSDNNKYNNQQF